MFTYDAFTGEIVGHINIRQPGQTDATRWRCSRARDSVRRAEDEEGKREARPVVDERLELGPQDAECHAIQQYESIKAVVGSR